MINYKTKFAAYYVVYVIAMGAILGIVSNLLLAVLKETVFKDSLGEIQYVVQVVIQTIFSILVLYLGIKPASNYAARKEDIPELPDMKRFVTILFIVLALIQVAYSVFSYMNVMEQINELKVQYPHSFDDKITDKLFKLKTTYIVGSIVLIVANFMMIPITLKKYEDV